MPNTLKNIKIARIASVSYFMATQLGRQIRYLKDQGMDVCVICSAGHELSRFDFSGSLHYECVEIHRSISIWHDLTALVRLFRIFRKYGFVLVHSTTPKAGLLTAIAGFFAAVPIRLHTFTGQAWVNKRGAVRYISRLSDKVIALLNTKCYADSRSQLEFLVKEGIVPQNKIDVIGAGSLAGVDLDRFNPDLWTQEEKRRLRAGLGIADESRLLIFIGRITGDKGIIELTEAFNLLLRDNYNVDLLLLGPLDRDCGGLESMSTDYNFNSDRIHYTGYDDCPEKYLAISDILCLPSYREGFGTVVIEAAAMGVPCVGTDIYGLKDSIIDGHTGVLVPPRNVEALKDALRHILDNPDLLMQLGVNARKRVVEEFDSRTINQMTAQEYECLLEKNRGISKQASGQ
jgi:glycosyltransferase involved in cell wall biosynthesis